MQWLAGMRITAARLQQGAPTDPTTYTPAVANGGSVVFNTQTGYYSVVDDWVTVVVYLTVGTAGSGTGVVTVDMPTNVDRSARQALVLHGETIGAGGAGTGIIRGGECAFFTSGSGGTSDRLRVDANAADGEGNIQGIDLKAGGLITIQGTYRMA